MDKRYNHKDHEQKIYSLWEKSGAFFPDNEKGKKPYCIIMPPPNANDPLHIGHAMFVTIEDLLIRFKRMQGYSALWLPGTDHAGIETQFVFEKKLKTQGKSRFGFDREKLYKLIWEYVQENSGIAIEQMKKIGASADWSRYKFTLDPDVQKLVIETLIKLNRDGLVYRDLRLVNFCTSCGTAFSDLEVKHVNKKTPLYYMRYGPFSLATVRPETKFGDTAVAVNPNDRRYQKWIGKEIEVEGLLGKFKMKVIADEYVDPEFGTGVVKVTPAHDPNDFEVWLRHKNEIEGPKQVIDFNGKLNEKTGKYKGMSVKEARKSVVEDLKKKGLLLKADENYEHSVGVCYRCGKTIEPLPLAQFFIKVKPLTDRTVEALKDKKVKVYGAGHDKVLLHWLSNLHDWNISRQIVWGIRLPIWYKIPRNKKQDIKNNEIFVKFLDRNEKLVKGLIVDILDKYSLKEIKEGLQELRAPAGSDFVVSEKSPGIDYIQETDTFDTWFSSAQWPVVTLKTNKPSDFERFYPTQVMETAYDILPFWVMRMLMMGLYLTNEVPFENVYFHGLIRDEKGQKMSKSKGNAINPLEVTDKYGADALRMALVIRSSAGLDKNVGEEDIRAMRNLTNKIWNATRFLILTIEDDALQEASASGDKKYLETLEKLIIKVENNLESYKIGFAAEVLYKEFWHWFCDECIEAGKKGEISKKILIEGMIVFLKMLHPFLPFVTEACYLELREAVPAGIRKTLIRDDLLIASKWPIKNRK